MSSADQAAEPFRFDRGRLTLLLVPIGALVAMANVGTALAPRLVTHHPALLITLDARNRHLLLVVAAGIGAVPFFTIGFFRLLVSDPLFFLLGRWYGEPALQWLEAKAGTGATRQLRWLERKFGRWGAPLVAIMPNNAICLFAGTSGMRPSHVLDAEHPRHDRPARVLLVAGQGVPTTRSRGSSTGCSDTSGPSSPLRRGGHGFQAYRSMSPRRDRADLGKVEDEIEALTVDDPAPDDENTVADDDNTDVR